MRRHLASLTLVALVACGGGDDTTTATAAPGATTATTAATTLTRDAAAQRYLELVKRPNETLRTLNAVAQGTDLGKITAAAAAHAEALRAASIELAAVAWPTDVAPLMSEWARYTAEEIAVMRSLARATTMADASAVVARYDWQASRGNVELLRQRLGLPSAQ